ncbi:MAG: PIG-L family deacetylase [Magnetococcales bacterium]|nr:PIG-L family deacetylase [Magnetococcales bacterium]
MPIILAIAPHADDETLGCGGTLLRHLHEGDEVHWLIMTTPGQELKLSPERIKRRQEEIRMVANDYGFAGVHELRFPAIRLDHLPMSDIVGALSSFFQTIEPNTLYLPYHNDVHSDHRVTFEASAACAKWFRHPSIRRMLSYETPSETGYGLPGNGAAFQPHVWVDIDAFLEKKIAILNRFQGEIGEFPFPRSEEVVRSLAKLRGSESGCLAAEAFMMLREFV